MKLKLAILLPQRVDVAALARARNMARLMLQACGAGGETVSVVIGLPDMPPRARRSAEQELRRDHPEIIVRPLIWESVPVSNARRMYLQLDPHLDLDGIDTVRVPRDWGWNFTDCDLWISLAEPGLGGILPLRPTAHFCCDLAVRIVPEAFASGIDDPYWQKQTEAFRLWRQSAVVVTSDASTVEDLVGFAGVRREKTAIMPALLPSGFVSHAADVRRDRRKLIWWLEPSHLHDIAVATEALALYLAEGGGLRPVIVSETIDEFGAGATHRALLALSPRLRALFDDLPRQNILSEVVLSRLASSAGVLWSSILAGGEGEGVIAAARAGAHFVGLDFGANRAGLEAVGGAAVLYRHSAVLEIVEALHGVEQAAVKAAPLTSARINFGAAIQGCGFVLDRLLEVTRAQ